MALGKHMSLRQRELFDRAEVPAHVPRVAAFERARQPRAPKPLPWESMGSWVRQIGRLLTVERSARQHFDRFDQTARELTAERIRRCRHADDLARVADLLEQAACRWLGGDLHGLDRVWSRAELGELRVEVRNRLHQLDIGRIEPRLKGPRFDPSRMPLERIEALIQSHPDMQIVTRLRAERERRRSQ